MLPLTAASRSPCPWAEHRPATWHPAVRRGALRSLQRHGWLKRLRSVDPMNMIIGQFHNILYDGHLYKPMHMVFMVVVCTVFFIGCLAVFRRYAPNLPRDI